MEEIREKTPEWEPIESYPPRTGFIEKIAMPGVLICGTLMIVAAVADVLFFNYLSMREDLFAIATGVFGIAIWVASRVFLGRIVL